MFSIDATTLARRAMLLYFEGQANRQTGRSCGDREGGRFHCGSGSTFLQVSPTDRIVLLQDFAAPARRLLTSIPGDIEMRFEVLPDTSGNGPRSTDCYWPKI